LAEGHVHDALLAAVNMAFGQTIRLVTVRIPGAMPQATVNMAFGHETPPELCNFKRR
jgi:hypothetical protein